MYREFPILHWHRVLSGDEADVTLDLGFGVSMRTKLRLSGTRTPKSRQHAGAAGPRARRRKQELLAKQKLHEWMEAFRTVTSATSPRRRCDDRSPVAVAILKIPKTFASHKVHDTNTGQLLCDLWVATRVDGRYEEDTTAVWTHVNAWMVVHGYLEATTFVDKKSAANLPIDL